MTVNIEHLATIVAPDTSIDATIREMGENSKRVGYPGLALAVDADGTLAGILTDGDIRRAYIANVDFRKPVSEIMVRDPVFVPDTLSHEELVPEVYRRVRATGRLSAQAVRLVLVKDAQGRVTDVIDFLQLLSDQDFRASHVAVIGMGYVGLTLAVHLASAGHVVTGIDIRKSLIEQLSRGQSHVFEPGLRELLSQALERGNLTFRQDLGAQSYKSYIVAVGSPVDTKGVPDLSALNLVVGEIGKRLKQGDLVMLRSTLPVGTTRNIVIPELDRLSGLEAGAHYSVAFTPERTAEGQAMRELRTLPQIVGGHSARCLSQATTFWSRVSPAVVKVASLEAAELVKLANNTFRDLSFAFSNELSSLADRFNVNAFDLIHAANEGYPRNPIPMPSPGVGGYCLTKDPLLYAAAFGQDPLVLGRASRRANDAAAIYPVSILQRFADRIGKPLSALRVLLIGIAFKGEPETTDLRGATALDTARELRRLGVVPFAWDGIVPGEELEAVGLKASADRDAAIRDADAVLILNNHRDNVPNEFRPLATGARKLIFDGWNQIDSREIEQISGWCYATMGYMSPAK